MAYLPVSDIEGNVVDGTAAAAVEDQVARPHLTGGDAPSAVGLRRRVMRQGDAKVRHDGHGKSGAVRTVCQAGSAPYIRVAHELYGIVGNLGTRRGHASCAGACALSGGGRAAARLSAGGAAAAA